MNKKLLTVTLTMALAVMLAFTMAVVGCSNPAGGNSNNSNSGNGNGNTNTGDNPGNTPGGNNTTLPAAKGKITVNGLSSFEGKYIFGNGMDGNSTPLFARVGMTESGSDWTITLAKISGGKAEIPLYYVEDTGAVGVYRAYEGNSQVRMLSLYVVESSELKESNVTSVILNNLDSKTIMNEGTFSGGNLTIDWGGEGGDTPGVGGVITSVSDVGTYLAAQSGGASASSPINLTVSLQLTEANWNDLTAAINTADKYVSLDLSDCTRSSANENYGLRSDGTFVGWIADKIVSLIGPNAATSIGEDAFFQCSMSSVDFPNVTSIGDAAFANCWSLTSVDFPKATSIGERAFAYCRSLTSVSFPMLTSVGKQAFDNCTSLTSVSFPNVTSIGISAFLYCTSLDSVDIPVGTPYGDYAFLGCPWRPTW